MSTETLVTRRYRGADIVPAPQAWPVAQAWAWTCPRCALRLEGAYQAGIREQITAHARPSAPWPPCERKASQA